MENWESIWENEAIISFRNIVSISIMLRGWAEVRPGSFPISPLFSNTFDFYPIILGKNGGFFYSTPAVNDYHPKNASLIGMPNNYVPIKYFVTMYDKAICDALITIWYQRFIKPGRNSFNSRQIFRSIEVAYHALSVPIKNQTTIFDLGVTFILWVSAFEILLHPKKGDVGPKKVITDLGTVHWGNKELNAKRYVVKIMKKRVNLCQKLYNEIYMNRNDFIHGNKISSRKLHAFGNKNLQHLWVFAPIIYRTALILYLDKYFPNLIKKLVLSDKSILRYMNNAPYENCLMQLMNKKRIRA